MTESEGAGPALRPADAGLDEAGYATRIEDAFIEERGTPFLVSSKDWGLIRGWRESGIPADTVVRAVRETFEKRRARGQSGKISSLAYCTSAVEERWEMERRGLVGKEIGPPLADPAARVEELAALVVALQGLGLNRAAGQVEELSADLPFEEIEQRLSTIEATLVRSLLKAMDVSSVAGIEARVSAALGDVSSLSPHVAERMRKALTRREVRSVAGFPPLTLLHG